MSKGLIVVESMLQPHNPAIYILPFILLFSGRVEDIALKMVHFIIPLAGRYDTLKRFLNNFEKVCLVTGENVKLVVILFKVEDVDCLVPRFFFSSCEQMVLNASSLYFLFQGPENGLHSDEDIVQLVDDLRMKYPSNDLSNDKNDPVREAEGFYLKPIFDWRGGGWGHSMIWMVEKGMDLFYIVEIYHTAIYEN